MKIDRGPSAGTLAAGRFITGHGEAGQLVQRIDEAGLAAFLDRDVADRDDRRDGGVVRALDQRTGDDNLFRR